jgi:uncharacterized protein
VTRPGDKAKDRALEDWLHDMHRDASAIIRNTQAVELAAFIADEVLQDHVIRRLTNIGEAAKYVGQFFPEFREANACVPWSKLARTRDVLNHAYFGTEPQLLWHMARGDMPPIVEELTRLIDGLRKRS